MLQAASAAADSRRRPDTRPTRGPTGRRRTAAPTDRHAGAADAEPAGTAPAPPPPSCRSGIRSDIPGTVAGTGQGPRRRSSSGCGRRRPLPGPRAALRRSRCGGDGPGRTDRGGDHRGAARNCGGRRVLGAPRTAEPDRPTPPTRVDHRHGVPDQRRHRRRDPAPPCAPTGLSTALLSEDSVNRQFEPARPGRRRRRSRTPTGSANPVPAAIAQPDVLNGVDALIDQGRQSGLGDAGERADRRARPAVAGRRQPRPPSSPPTAAGPRTPPGCRCSPTCWPPSAPAR